jgi:hypothetical protein
MAFSLVEEQMIVNSVEQLNVNFYDASNVLSPTFNTPNHKVVMPQFAFDFRRSELLSAVKVVGSNGVALVSTLTLVSNAVAGDEFIVFCRASTLEQDGGNLLSSIGAFNKNYYFVATSALTPAQLAANIFNTIVNSEYYADAPFTVTNSGANITFTMKEAGVDLKVHVTKNGVGGNTVATYNVTTPANLGVNNYNTLRRTFSEANIEEIQPKAQRLNMPQPGIVYTSYTWRVRKKDLEYGSEIAGAEHYRVVSYTLYVNPALTTLITRLDLIVP